MSLRTTGLEADILTRKEQNAVAMLSLRLRHFGLTAKNSMPSAAIGIVDTQGSTISEEAFVTCIKLCTMKRFW
jgi:hypothetical protein